MMINFVDNNSSELIISAVSLVIGIVASWIFYWLQIRVSNTAQKERTKRAWEDVTDIVESHIVNKHDLSALIIESLIQAAERRYEVQLSDRLSPVSILQDAAFNLQKSRHIDHAKKAEFVDQIEELIAGITVAVETSNAELAHGPTPYRIERVRNEMMAVSVLVVTLLTTMLAFVTLSDKFLDSNNIWLGFVVAGISAVIALVQIIINLSERAKRTMTHSLAPSLNDNEIKSDKVS